MISRRYPSQLLTRGRAALAWWLAAFLLLLLLGIVLSGRLSHPWTYNDDYNGAFWAQAARNLNQTGFLATWGVPAPLYFGLPPIPAEALYVHHPTLLTAMMAADRSLLGESEAAARMLPILFSLLTAFLLWVMVSRCSGPRPGALALAFFISAPMELHYGQMVNFEAPELFFLLAALCCFHLWLRRPSMSSALATAAFCSLAMWTDWQGYLLVILLLLQLIYQRRPGWRRMGAVHLAAMLLAAALLSGGAFLLQIHLANPGAWGELLHALAQRSSQSGLTGAHFTQIEWARTEAEYLTTLFNPFALGIAACGAAAAILLRPGLSREEKVPLDIAAALFVIGLLYVCGLRNQSYIHDFAGFYLLVPFAIYSGFALTRLLALCERRFPRRRVMAAILLCIIPAIFIVSGIHQLAGIDTQFCILGDDSSEPPSLMPDTGGLIAKTFAQGAIILCNFDRYYSPLPYYARHVMVNDLRTYPDWQGALADAAPQPVGGIIWLGEPDAAELLRHLPSAETRKATIDGIPFLLWIPAHAPAS